jgi:hypothetical protein
MPNVTFAALGMYLVRMSARERTSARLETVQLRAAALRDRLLARLGAEASP